MKRRVILSVYDKMGLIGFGKQLAQLGFELVASGGTASPAKRGRAGCARGVGRDRRAGNAWGAGKNAPSGGAWGDFGPRFG